uniref:Si:dkeyp-68b7.10 n=1 Tax=Tetraodon nigroviridis TaxID=99883 RepID=H3C400_TETNG
MEESYETFEEELGPQRAGPPPQKPVHRRPETYAKRKVTEDLAPQRPRAEARTLAREPSFSRTAPLHRAPSIPNLSQTEKPWENVTLNRCLVVAITILVLASGLQRLHETLRSQRAVEEEEDVGLRVRRSGALRHRGQEAEPETTLWEVMFWWLPDLDDEEEDEEDEEDDEGENHRVKTKRGGTARPARSLRNKQLNDKKLMKRREGKLKDRRAKKKSDDKIREKEEREDPADVEEEEPEEPEEFGQKNKQPEERKVKKKTAKA